MDTYYNGGRIRPRGVKFLAEINRDYKCRRKVFPTETECRAWIDQEQLVAERVIPKPDSRQILDAHDARRLLPCGVTLVDAAKHWLATHKQNPMSRLPLSELYARYLADKAAAGLRPRSLAAIRTFVGRLNYTYADLPITAITPQLLSEYLTTNQCSPVLRNSLRRYWISFFDYCRRMGALSDNPAVAISISRLDEHMPDIFTVDQAQDVLKATLEIKPILLPSIAFGLLTGLRTSELLGIKWEDVSLDSIRVIPAVAKKRRQRIICLPDNLKACIPAWKIAFIGNICPMKERRLYHYLELIAAKAGLKTWPKNAMRHSFASYHLALYQDAAKTAALLGHTQNAAVLWNHYRELVTEADAKRYFALELQGGIGAE